MNNKKINELASLFAVTNRWSAFVKKAHTHPWRILYFCFLPKGVRQKLSLKADIEQKKMMARASKTFLQHYLKGDLTKFNLRPKKKLTSNKIIWQYWGQGIGSKSVPEIVKICFNSVDRYKKDYEVIRLDDNTIKEYIDLPDFVWQKRQNQEFKYAFFSDVIRLALLDIYGGIWIDATILLTDYIPENIEKMNFFMFQRDNNAQNKVVFEQFSHSYFGWHPHHYVNVLNSFIVSKKQGLIVHTCLDLLLNFWATQNTIRHYFFFQILFNELINNDFYRDGNCPIIDDTLTHILQAKLTEPFDQTEFEIIKQKSSIHKMTYVKNCVPNSYYEYIKQCYCK